MATASASLRPPQLLRLATALIVLALTGDAVAQGVPYREGPDGYRRTWGTAEHRAGVFDYYVLVLSWSPTYCAELRETRSEPQCQAGGGRPYAFVLHGLWPQYRRGWPEYCRSPDRGYVPRGVANRMLDIMPSHKLIFNEYRKHGTCSGLGVDGYFNLARRLFDEVRIPERFLSLTDERLMLSPDEVVADFVAANLGLEPDIPIPWLRSREVIVAVCTLFMLFGPALGLFIRQGVARQREYLADAEAVLLTRDPEGLALALTRIGAWRGPGRLALGPSASHLCIVDPTAADSLWWDRIFPCHPPIQDRVELLARMGAGIDGSVLQAAAEEGAKAGRLAIARAREVQAATESARKPPRSRRWATRTCSAPRSASR